MTPTTPLQRGIVTLRNTALPTWSWASTDSPISYHPDLLGQECSHVLVDQSQSFCVLLLQGYPTGAVKSGQLLIEGLVVPVKLVTVERSYRMRRSYEDSWNDRQTIVRNHSGMANDVACDIKRPVELRSRDAGYKCWMWQKNSWCLECEPAVEEWDQPKYWCLRVASYDYGVITIFSFLVLERSKTVEGAWERVGVGNFEGSINKGGKGSLFEGGISRKLL